MERGQHPIHSRFDTSDTDAEMRKTALNSAPTSETIPDLTDHAVLAEEDTDEELSDIDIVVDGKDEDQN